MYYHGRYWNDLERVRQHLNCRATGSPGLGWYEHAREFAGPFDRALILNCGNGWVERDLLNLGTIRSAVGIDVSVELVTQARSYGFEQLTYEVCDINKAEFPPGPFDVIINHAAAHHIAYIDRVFRSLQDVIPTDGLFVSWDYVGPHRNQYGERAWAAACDANDLLPTSLRAEMRYPHERTMIVSDPTEAVHSELFRRTLSRYFEIRHERPLGGAIAYLLLTFNDPFQAAVGRNDAEALAALEQVLAADELYTNAYPEDSLFAYVIASPNSMQHHPTLLAEWSREEVEREVRARANDGAYYPPTPLAKRFGHERRIDPIRRVTDRLPVSLLRRLKSSPAVAVPLAHMRARTRRT